MSLPKSGAVYHFTGSPSSGWSFSQKIVANDTTANHMFGRSLAFNGEVLVVGAPGNTTDTNGNGPALASSGATYVFNATAPGYTGWSQTQKLVVPAPHRAAGELFGFSVALDKNVQYLVVGAPRDRHNLDEVSNPIVNAGSAYVYKLAGSGSPWNAFFLQKLVASSRAKERQ